MVLVVPLCERFAGESPRGIVVADSDFEKAQLVADSVGGLAVACDVGQGRADSAVGC